MFAKLKSERRYLEIVLILIVLATSCLFYRMEGYKMIVLHMFYLPIIISGFFIGRYHSGLLAVFCVILASAVTAFGLTDFATSNSPVIIGLGVAVWACTLGLTALMVGTLSDDRTAKTNELHEAYIGIVEVLSRYLQGANPKLKARSFRVAELGQMVAMRMRLSPRDIENIRVAALLWDIGKIEVTTKLINKALDTLEANPEKLQQGTFQGMDLVHSLGAVLSSNILLLLDSNGAPHDCHITEVEETETAFDIPIGSKIIRMVRAYDDLTEGDFAGPTLSPQEAIGVLGSDATASDDKEILDALECVVLQAADRPLEQSEGLPANVKNDFVTQN